LQYNRHYSLSVMLSHAVAVFDGLGTDFLCFHCACKMIGY
jgi:hypothetical protein